MNEIALSPDLAVVLKPEQVLLLRVPAKTTQEQARAFLLNVPKRLRGRLVIVAGEVEVSVVDVQEATALPGAVYDEVHGFTTETVPVEGEVL